MKKAQPSFKRTYKFFQRLNKHFTFGFIAKVCGKDIKTAEGWAREPESVENPLGSGRRNPLDTVLRLIALAHEKDAGLAREMALSLHEYIDFLDQKKGVETAQSPGSLCDLIGRSAQEHTDIIVKGFRSGAPDYQSLKVEHLQAMSALIQLGACIDEELKKEIQADLDKQEFGKGLRRVA